jgi:hypothetical protein
MTIKNKKDFWAGLLFMGFGAFFVGFGSKYMAGSAAQMGPGYFPRLIGGILVILGLLVSMGSLKTGAKAEDIEWGPWLVVLQILGPIVLFGLFLSTLGLVVSLIMLVVLSCLACKDFARHEIVMTALVLALMSYALFVQALQLQFPVWPAFFA